MIVWGEAHPDVCYNACVRRPNGPQWLCSITQHTDTHRAQRKKHIKALSKVSPPAPSQEDPITACASIKTVPPSALWLLIAISSPQWVPTQAAQVRLYNCPPEKQHNGVSSVYVADKTNLSLLKASFPIVLVGTHMLACYFLYVK